MTDFNSYLFLINPVSGSARPNWKDFFEMQRPDNLRFKYIFWDLPERKNEIIKEIETSNAEVLVAVGGDGTINLLAEIALKKNKALGIIPAGSGNGLARHLKIPLDSKKALGLLLNAKVKEMDMASVNGIHFLCTAGVGFDAVIGKEFAKRDTTGIWGYIKKVLDQAFTYKAQKYSLNYEKNSIEREAFMITFANASQYGNNAFIAPSASVQDGKLNICIMRPFPLIMALPIVFRLFTRSLDKSKYLETLSLSEIQINRKPGPVHLDGDPHEMNGMLDVRVIPEKIKVLY